MKRLIPRGEWRAIIEPYYYEKPGQKSATRTPIRGGNTRHFGYKAHISADKDSGLLPHAVNDCDPDFYAVRTRNVGWSVAFPDFPERPFPRFRCFPDTTPPMRKYAYPWKNGFL